MDTVNVTRSYLERLSTSDLISLADEYGIDIPEDLNRRFIIGELLEATEELNEDKKDTMHGDGVAPDGIELPESYNETTITAVMQNPVWCYVYWDFKVADKEKILHTPSFMTFVLKVTFFSDDEKVTETFDINISPSCREQYVLLPSSETAARIDLYAEFKNMEPVCLAKSGLVSIPKGCPELGVTAIDSDIPEIIRLSGFPELIRTHYLNHRQSFS